MGVLSFLIFAFLFCLILISALGVVAARSISLSLVCMMVCFLGVSGIFFSLGADFAGASQIILYGVSVAILMAFAIMLVSKKDDGVFGVSFSWRSLIGVMCCFGILVILFFAMSDGGRGFPAVLRKNIPPEAFSSTFKTASELFSSYILPFEVLSLVLLIVLLGAAVIAGKEGR